MLALLSSARLDKFEKVKEAIDGMVKDLQAQHQAEIAHRDSCITNLNDNELNTASEAHSQEGFQSKLDTLLSQDVTVKNTITMLQSEVDEMKTQIARAGENRAKEHAEFQMTLADQKAAQALLEQALAVMKSRYADAKLVQLAQHAHRSAGAQAPPEGFKEFEKSSGHATGVVALLEHIIADTIRLEQEASDAEAAADSNFQSFATETKASVDTKMANIVDRKLELSTIEKEIATTKEGLKSSAEDLHALSLTKADLNGACDFFLQNFDVRQEARAQEVESLHQAKAYLSGMK